MTETNARYQSAVKIPQIEFRNYFQSQAAATPPEHVY